MSGVGADAIEHLAELARLSVEPEEAARLGGELERILAYLAALQSVDVGGVPEFRMPARHAGREDEPGATLDRTVVLDTG